jgi:hypothetical protein
METKTGATELVSVSASSRAIDPGRGVAFQPDDSLRLALVHGLPGAGKLRGNAALLVAVPAPHEKDPGARCKQDEKLRHG